MFLEHGLLMQNNYCELAFYGLTINPQGYVVPCCSAPDYHLKHISEVDDLNDLYLNDPQLKNIRKNFEDGLYGKFDPCNICYKEDSSGTRSNKVEWDGYFKRTRSRLRHLEITTSNACNSTCATCFGLFSSSWTKLEEKYNLEKWDSFRISDTDIEKIKKVLPGLEFLNIKGGEPFSDPRNIILFGEYLKYNKFGKLNLLTNGQLFDVDLFKNVDKTRVIIGLSVDGTGDLYNWIRSTDWNTVIGNMKRLYETTGIQSNVCSVLSLYNFWNVEEFVDYFIEQEWCCSLNMTHQAYFPEKCSIDCLPPDVVSQRSDEIVKYLEKKQYRGYESTRDFFKAIKSTGSGMEKAHEWIELMNTIRGFSLYDLVPELNKYRN